MASICCVKKQEDGRYILLRGNNFLNEAKKNNMEILDCLVENQQLSKEKEEEIFNLSKKYDDEMLLFHSDIKEKKQKELSLKATSCSSLQS